MPEAPSNDHPTGTNDASARQEGHAWVDRFVLQLTNQGVVPSAIDTAVADVRAHCADSGETPQAAFGDPASYATTLAAEMASNSPPPGYNARRFATLLPMTVGLAVGIVGLVGRDGERVSLTLGHVLLVTVAVPAWTLLTSPLALPRPRDPMRPHRPAFDERGLRGLWLLLGLVAVGAVLWATLDERVLTVPKWLPVTVWAAGFILSFVLFRWLAPRTARASESPSRNLGA